MSMATAMSLGSCSTPSTRLSLSHLTPSSSSSFTHKLSWRCRDRDGKNSKASSSTGACIRTRATAASTASGSQSYNQNEREFVLRDFCSRRALKIISGLQNFNKDSVASVVIAAQKGGATHVDIACDPELVKLAISLTCLPVCVSAVDPEAFLTAVEAGAHMIEIGNYDSFYESGRTFASKEILQLAQKTRKLFPSIVLSVTVPHTLSLTDQVNLAELLEREGVDIIQTEGGTSSDPSHSGVHGLIEKAVPTLAAAYSISRAVEIPVICASGMSSVTAPMALSVGAAGVGVGSAVNKLNNQVAMIAEVKSIAEALGLSFHASNTNFASIRGESVCL